jgi:predicted transposase YbfD/YdcC
LTLTGLVVTLDALHTHVEVAQEIIDAGGDYLMVVKGNQPTQAVALPPTAKTPTRINSASGF